MWKSVIERVERKWIPLPLVPADMNQPLVKSMWLCQDRMKKQGFLWKRTQERILAILISLLIRISGGEWYASTVSRQNENKTSGSEENGRTQPPLQLAGELFELKLSKKNCFGVESSGFPKFST